MAIVASFTLRSAPATGACGTVGRREARRFVIVHAPVSAHLLRRRRVVDECRGSQIVRRVRRMQGRVLGSDGGRDVWRMGGECGDVDGGVVMGRRM